MRKSAKLLSLFTVMLLLLNISIPALASDSDSSAQPDTVISVDAGESNSPQHPDGESPATPSSTTDGSEDEQHPDTELSGENLTATPGTTGGDDSGATPGSENTIDELPQQIPQQITLEVDTFAIGDGTVAKLVASEHALMLRGDGRLLVWGNNAYSQLGLGTGADTIIYEPTELTFFKDSGLTIVDIAVCEDASFVLCGNGELYSFGKGLNGRLGLGHTNNVNTPTLVPGSQSLRLTELYAGKEFIVAVSDFNSLYAWGRNSKGQLGTGDRIDAVSPVKIMENADIKILNVGEDFVILLRLDNRVIVWGNTDKGQLPLSSYIRGKIEHAFDYAPGTTFASWGGSAINSTPVEGSLAYYNTTEAIENYLSPSILGIDARVTNLIPTVYSAQSANTYVNGPQGSNLLALIDVFNNGTSVSGNDINYLYGTQWNDVNGFGGHLIAVHTYWTETPLIDFTSSVDVSKISSLQVGNKHGYLTYDGTEYSWGDNSIKQQSSDSAPDGHLIKAQTINDFIKNLDNYGDGFNRLIVAGDTGYILTSGGDPYAWGANPSGKAGLGSASYIETPTLISSLSGKSIADIVEGKNGAYYVSHNGDVYYSGDNLYGQSGLGDEYKSSSKIQTPIKMENLKFSATELPPDAPDSLDTPDEVETKQEINISWGTVPGAKVYELKRYFTPSQQTFGITTMGTEEIEIVYSGSESIVTDIAPEEAGVLSYSVKALNYINDYSPARTSSPVNVLDNNGNSNNDNNDNSSNNGGGLTDDQFLQLLTLLQSSGLDDGTIAALIAANRRNSSGDVNVDVNTPAADNKDLAALVAALTKSGNNGGGQDGTKAANVYNQGMSVQELAEFIQYLGESKLDTIPEDTIDSIDTAIKVKTLEVLQNLTTQSSGIGAANTAIAPTYQIVQNPVPKYLSLYLTIGLIVTILGLIFIRIIPEVEEDVKYNADS